ncbi:hypothetical protein KOEU_38960 [Komagataeibacter europaeus]|uniref:Uncharacterized protein n=1 Tax=Komagataeibacter europaeus TaxID=33995 RepID=A0A0M0EBL1_KOMEU|nr:hypothetical protein [Komagataeibacter europaeus]KON62623.1 hypothetical protein KOEU_38960 [Komagataeibacter europaeus]
MSILSELAIPLTREQSIDTASAYAEQIKGSPRLKTLAYWRFRAKEQGAPAWFIKMIDVEVNVIINRLVILEEWGRAGDSWAFASHTMRLIYWADMMARQYINPHMMDAHNTDKVEVWLQTFNQKSPRRD